VAPPGRDRADVVWAARIVAAGGVERPPFQRGTEELAVRLASGAGEHGCGRPLLDGEAVEVDLEGEADVRLVAGASSKGVPSILLVTATATTSNRLLDLASHRWLAVWDLG